MKFEALMRLYPPGYFGLPDGDAKIIPGTLGQQFNIESDPIDSSTLEKVGHGTMPVYRRPEEALNLNLKSGDVEVALKDNYLTLNFEAEGYDDATLKARAFALGLLRRLNVTMGVLFHYRRVKLTGEDGRVVPSLPKAHFTAAVYSLTQLKQAVVDAVELLSVSDAVLERALLYYEHANLLMERMEAVVDRFEDHRSLVFSGAFLNLWKALSTIVGDRTKGDDFRKRIAALGLPDDFYDNEVKPITVARNDYDVAHYALPPDAVERARTLFGRGELTARKAILAYAKYLSSGNPSFDSPSR